MELTTGAILRRITETPLSTAAHKLATIILDGIAWKDGYMFGQQLARHTLVDLTGTYRAGRIGWQVCALAVPVRGAYRNWNSARCRVICRRHITI